MRQGEALNTLEDGVIMLDELLARVDGWLTVLDPDDAMLWLEMSDALTTTRAAALELHDRLSAGDS